MPHSREEVQAAFDRYLAVRDGINAGNGTWADLAQFFTDDAVFVDPAWGRVEGIEEMKATVFGEAMVGLEEWTFPTEFTMIDGDNVVIKWSQVLPGRPAGAHGCRVRVHRGHRGRRSDVTGAAQRAGPADRGGAGG